MIKIYSYERNENTGIAKLFGIKIYEFSSDYMTAERKQSFLHGLISTYKINDEYSFHTEKNIKILGIPITKRIEDGNNFIWYILGIPVKKRSLEDMYRKYYMKKIKEKYDDVYILDANSGEIYLFLTYFADAFLKKNNSKKPLFIATKKYHTDLIRTICPEVPYILVEKLRKNIKSDSFISKGTRFFMIFQHRHFKEIDHNLKNSNGDVHYFNAISKRLGIDESQISKRLTIIPKDDEISMLEKVKAVGLNLENFIFIAPEAQSCRIPDKEFWVKIINEYKNRGYDIFVNLTGKELDLSETEYKSCFLTYSEAFILAKMSKKIISLRSGFTEYLLQTGVPIDILYTEFVNRHFFDDFTASQVLSGFTVRKIPMINQNLITEYDMSKYKYEDMYKLLSC